MEIRFRYTILTHGVKDFQSIDFCITINFLKLILIFFQYFFFN